MQGIDTLIVFLTLVFLIAPAFLLIYVNQYNKRKKRHIEEKEMMKLTFESEIAKTNLEVQEQTMETIGRELHDNIGQLLSLVSQTLNSVKLEEPEKARQKIDSAVDFTMLSIKELRQLGKLLQGEQLIGLGLCEAIRQMINWIEKSGQYLVNYDIEGEQPAQNNPDKDLILFRILQEVFNNIIKHSKASEINIKLTYGQGGIRLQVIDNGAGFDINHLQEDQKGMGLLNIQKRAEIVGGEISIQSQPGEGTCIEIFIPYP